MIRHFKTYEELNKNITVAEAGLQTGMHVIVEEEEYGSSPREISTTVYDGTEAISTGVKFLMSCNLTSTDT